MQATQQVEYKDTVEFNGWFNWDTWNVALWLDNDPYYASMVKLCRSYAEFLVMLTTQELKQGTPDGGEWNQADHKELNVHLWGWEE